MYGLDGATSYWNGIKLYPRGLSPYSDDVLAAHFMDWANGDLDRKPFLFTLFDVWVLKSKSLDQVPNIVSWVPIDHQPCPPEVVEWCKRTNVFPVAMSEFGQKMLEHAGVNCAYVPHGIEATYKPTPEFQASDRMMSGRELIGVSDDRFVVMMNAANKGTSPPRKAFGENLLAFSIFAKSHPDAVLYLHTERDGAYGGIHLPNLIAAVGLNDEQVRIVDQYAYRAGLPQPAVASLYSAADVLLATSLGEGFGIPVVEAQACGTRVIVSDFTAQSELCGAGWKVEVQPYWDHQQRSWFGTPKVPQIVAALEAAYAEPRGVCKEAVEFAAQYEAGLVFDNYWKPALQQIAKWSS
jgi:glycosyltransferase involved in cell wall biosynthesis